MCLDIRYLEHSTAPSTWTSIQSWTSYSLLTCIMHSSKIMWRRGEVRHYTSVHNYCLYDMTWHDSMTLMWHCDKGGSDPATRPLDHPALLFPQPAAAVTCAALKLHKTNPTCCPVRRTRLMVSWSQTVRIVNRYILNRPYRLACQNFGKASRLGHGKILILFMTKVVDIII